MHDSYFFVYGNTQIHMGKKTYLQKVIQVIANTFFIMADIPLISSVTESRSNRLVHVQNVRCLTKDSKSFID